MRILIPMLLLSACFQSFRRETRRDAGFAQAREGDALFAMRGEDPAKVGAAIELWEAGLFEHPTSPSLLLRLTRARTMQVMYGTHDPIHDLSDARELGIRCLMLDAPVAVLITSFGRLEENAIQQSSRAACLAWTSMAWSRWLLARGVAGAAIDIPRVEALARRAQELRPGLDDGLPLHALGIAQALPPEPLSPDLAAAEASLLEAHRLAPQRLQIQTDLAILVYGPQPERSADFRSLLEEVIATPPSTGPEEYLNVAARRQAAVALLEGPQPRWGETHD